MDDPNAGARELRARELLRRLFSGTPGHIRDHEAIRLLVNQGLADAPHAEVLVRQVSPRMRN